MRYLVTGGAGFLGSNLVASLLNRGDRVVCMDNFQTGLSSNLGELEDHPGFELINHDVVNPYKIEVDGIFNFACPASPPAYQRFPVETFKTSVIGTLNALNLASELNVPILQASTSEIYGDPLEHPQNEKYWGNVNPIGPRSCYDEGKRGAESLCFDFVRQNNINVKVVRIFNTYGPKMRPDDGRVVSNLIVNSLKNQPIEIYGDGSQTRSFCYVDDLIEGILKLWDHPKKISTPVNLGNPSEISVSSIVDLVKKITGSTSRIEYKVLPTDDPRRRCPDISLARELLNWEPKVELVSGISNTIEYFKGPISLEG